MRFAYIDSHGNEVPIPSVDALALRIELGAIGADTELYDAQADLWGPARTHEIFHTLSRDSEGDGFVAPPPAPSVPPPSVPAPEPADTGPSGAAASSAKKPAKKSAPPKPAPAPPKDDGDFDLGLTLAAPPQDEVKAEADKGSPGSAPDDGGFDFGDLGSGLELEEPLAGATPPLQPKPNAGPDESAMDFSGGMELESAIDFASADGGGMELETPMSHFEPESPSGWTGGGAGEGEEDILDFSSVSSETAADEQAVPVEPPVQQARAPRSRPSAPKFKRQRSLSGPIVFIVLLLAVGVGGYSAWPFVGEWLEQRNAPARPAVVMPDIPPELLPIMESLAAAAIADLVEALDDATTADGAPTEPDQEWLGGEYLGNASRFAGVEAFWTGVEAFLGRLEAADWQGYHDAFVARVESSNEVAADQAPLLVQRADSGFVAAAPLRAQVYAVMGQLVGASLDLHDFLLENEASIEHRPGVSSTTDPTVDPVLEISAPEAYRTQMLDLFDEITTSLAQLGSLDRVTRDRLMGALTARLQQVGIE